MISISFRDLLYRSRQFLIAVVGAGLVFAMALLLSGMSNSFRAEVDRTVAAVDAERWVIPAGSTGPFTSFGALAGDTVDQVAALDGVEQADPLVIIPMTVEIDDDVESLRLIGHRTDGLGAPPLAEGRATAAPGEVVADERLGLEPGDELVLGEDAFEVVGLTSGLTLLGGIPNVYVEAADAQAVAFQGADFVTAVVTEGVPTGTPDDLTVLTPEEVEADTLGVMDAAVSSIDSTRALMWVVAAIIVAALMYVSALERLRDFAVLKSLGSSSRLLFVGVAVQAITVTLLAAAFATAASLIMKPFFALPIAMPSSAFVALPIVAIVVGLLASLVALRRAIAVDPSSAFAAAS